LEKASKFIDSDVHRADDAPEIATIGRIVERHGHWITPRANQPHMTSLLPSVTISEYHQSANALVA
jgi:hypothetical protein